MFGIGWPEGILLLIILSKLLYVAGFHGQMVKINAVNQLTHYTLILMLLIWGGFFS